jgi:hypothetical protein
MFCQTIHGEMKNKKPTATAPLNFTAMNVQKQTPDAQFTTNPNHESNTNTPPLRTAVSFVSARRATQNQTLKTLSIPVNSEQFRPNATSENFYSPNHFLPCQRRRIKRISPFSKSQIANRKS